MAFPRIPRSWAAGWQLVSLLHRGNDIHSMINCISAGGVATAPTIAVCILLTLAAECRDTRQNADSSSDENHRRVLRRM